ncbi:MAG: CYTH domain-containing protein [Pararhizobium sp.]
MAREIERKFLVATDGWRGEADAGVALRQAYLFIADDRSLRVRIPEHGAARLTLKIGSGTMSRDEFEYEVDRTDAEAMARQCVGMIEKRRHRLVHAGRVWEIDVYSGRLLGLVVAEVELDSEEARPDLPDWLGREVTHDPAFLNSALALRGLPPENGR